MTEPDLCTIEGCENLATFTLVDYTRPRTLERDGVDHPGSPKREYRVCDEHWRAVVIPHPFRPGMTVQKAGGERALVLGVYPHPGGADEIYLRTVEGPRSFLADAPEAREWTLGPLLPEPLPPV